MITASSAIKTIINRAVSPLSIKEGANHIVIPKRYINKSAGSQTERLIFGLCDLLEGDGIIEFSIVF